MRAPRKFEGGGRATRQQFIFLNRCCPVRRPPFELAGCPRATMLAALQLPCPSYLAAPLLQPPLLRTCAAPPQPRAGAASLTRPPMCARRTSTLFALAPEPSGVPHRA